jgi:hypothetical protein
MVYSEVVHVVMVILFYLLFLSFGYLYGGRTPCDVFTGIGAEVKLQNK